MKLAAIVGAVVLAVAVAGSAGAAKLITGKDIKNGSITANKLSKSARRALRGKRGPRGQRGPRGERGPSGPAGPAGPAGPQGSSTTLRTVVRSAKIVAPPYDFAHGEVRCPDGMVAVGGSVAPGGLSVAWDAPTADGRGWSVSALETIGATDFSLLVFVVCAPGSAQVLAVGASRRISNRARAAAEAAARKSAGL